MTSQFAATGNIKEGPAVPGSKRSGTSPSSPGKPTKSARQPAASRESRIGRTSLQLISVLSVVCGIGLWALASATGAVVIPGPRAVLDKAVELVSTGVLPSDLGASLARVLTGFVLGTILAIPVGFLMGWYPLIRAAAEPYVQFFRTVPPLAIIPLAIVIMGIDETPKIFVIFLASFLSCVVATFQGVVTVDKTLINAARVLGASSFVVFRRVVVPASSPFILVGMRIGLGASWATVVAAELIAAQSGLGFRMQQAQLYYDLPTIFVQLICIGTLGLIMDRALLLLEARLTRWQERR
ncbi:ABC transporter permease [Paenarthrobacter sp. CC6]|uniref:ABC transporter permease n=1 Tax=Paenarthrobacter sp. CC6 TaxID=3029184 RepID=UPI00339CCB74